VSGVLRRRFQSRYHDVLDLFGGGRREPTSVDHPCLEPVGDQSPVWERAELTEQVGMIDAVERRRQIRVERPTPPGVRAPGDVEDGVDRIVAATARPEPVGPGLEPCLPLGFQRVDDPGLKAPVDNHPDPFDERRPSPRPPTRTCGG